MRRTTLISTAVVIALLAGCGKKTDESGTEPVATGGTGEASSSRDAEWQLIAPLVAGNYGGECQRLPDGQPAPGSVITVAADGKFSAPGVGADLRQASMISVGREVRNGVVKPSVMISTKDTGGVTVSLLDDGTGRGAVSIMGDENQLTCANKVTLDKIRSQPLYKTAAKLMDVPALRVRCADVATKRESLDTEFKLANGIATLGSQTFALEGAQSETLTMTQGETGLGYAFTGPDGARLHLYYGEPGKLKGLQGGSEALGTHVCEVAG